MKNGRAYLRNARDQSANGFLESCSFAWALIFESLGMVILDLTRGF